MDGRRPKRRILEELTEQKSTFVQSSRRQQLSDSEVDDLSDDQYEMLEVDGNSDAESVNTIPSLVDEKSDEEDIFETVIGADGNPRTLFPEIDPHYSSDDTDYDELNTIGNIPISAYEKFPHIGYNIDGKRIMRPATVSAIDSMLETIDLPKGWTGLLDKQTGKALNLSNEDMELIGRIQQGLLPDDSVNPFADQLEWFSNVPRKMPLSARAEPKSSFGLSKSDAQTIAKLVKAIQQGRLTAELPKEDEDYDIDDDRQMRLPKMIYDIWADDKDFLTDRQHHTLPKPALPTHAESYNPPEEYLPDDSEAGDQDNNDELVPRKYSALRLVPAYAKTIDERYRRCLDLYMLPRSMDVPEPVDADSLLPRLPSPQDLRPFPIRCSVIFKGHKGKVTSISIHPSGEFVVTGGEDGSTRLWETLTGRELWRVNVLKDDTYNDKDVESDDRVESVAWHPILPLLAISAGECIYLMVPPTFDENSTKAAHAFATRGLDSRAAKNAKDAGVSRGTWTKPGSRLSAHGCDVVVRCKHIIRQIRWHPKGNYLASVAPNGGSSAILIHQFSKYLTQSPFRKSSGIVQCVCWHPYKPQLFVATQRFVRLYDLQQQKQVKKLNPDTRWISSIAVHPHGDNIIVGTFDKRVAWHDLELSDKPYKTLRYQTRAVRDVRFHQHFPLFCSAGDDGNINVLHGAVFDDLRKNPLLVPLKILRGHECVSSVGVLQVEWHPREPWLFSTGADGTARLWTN